MGGFSRRAIQNTKRGYIREVIPLNVFEKNLGVLGVGPSLYIGVSNGLNKQPR